MALSNNGVLFSGAGGRLARLLRSIEVSLCLLSPSRKKKEARPCPGKPNPPQPIASRPSLPGETQPPTARPVFFIKTKKKEKKKRGP